MIVAGIFIVAVIIIQWITLTSYRLIHITFYFTPILILPEAYNEKIQILKLQNDESFMRQSFVLSEQMLNERIMPMAPKCDGPSTNSQFTLY